MLLSCQTFAFLSELVNILRRFLTVSGNIKIEYKVYVYAFQYLSLYLK